MIKIVIIDIVVSMIFLFFIIFFGNIKYKKTKNISLAILWALIQVAEIITIYNQIKDITSLIIYKCLFYLLFLYILYYFVLFEEKVKKMFKIEENSENCKEQAACEYIYDNLKYAVTNNKQSEILRYTTLDSSKICINSKSNTLFSNLVCLNVKNDKTFIEIDFYSKQRNLKIIKEHVTFQKYKNNYLKKCPNCNAENSDSKEYCDYCGTKLYLEKDNLKIVDIENFGEIYNGNIGYKHLIFILINIIFFLAPLANLKYDLDLWIPTICIVFKLFFLLSLKTNGILTFLYLMIILPLELTLVFMVSLSDLSYNFVIISCFIDTVLFLLAMYLRNDYIAKNLNS